MPIQSCIFIPAVPEGWHKSEQRSAWKPASPQAIANSPSAWWNLGWSFSLQVSEAGPKHLCKVKVLRRGSPNGTCLSRTNLALLWASGSAAQPLSSPSAETHSKCMWFLGPDFTWCTRLIPTTSLAGDPARAACCLLPLLPPLHFPLLLELNRIFPLAPTPAAAEKSYWNHFSSKRQAGIKGS